MKFVHFFRTSREGNLIDHDSPRAHLYVNPASVACIYGRTADLTTVEFLNDADGYEVVEGFAADVARLLEEATY